jgi:hypothetical protein
MDKQEIINYMKENGHSVLLVVVLIIGLMVFFSLVGIDLNPVVNNNLEKVVTIEKFSSNSICDYNKDLSKLEKVCNSLSDSKCKDVDCCDLVNSNSAYTCKAIDKKGNPIYNNNDKENFMTDQNYYDNRLKSNDNDIQLLQKKNTMHQEMLKKKYRNDKVKRFAAANAGLNINHHN